MCESAKAYNKGKVYIFPGIVFLILKILAGGIDPGENSMQAAMRETEEEVGVKGRIICELGTYFD